VSGTSDGTGGVSSGTPGPPADQEQDPGVFFVRLQLFLSSYAPLFAILAIRFNGTALKTVCAVLAGYGVLYLMVVVWLVPRLAQPRSYPVDSVDDAAGEVAGYLATYLLPFVAVPSPSAADLAAYCIVGVVIAVIFTRSELARINPTLYLLGWRVAVIGSGPARRYLVCRRLPRAGTSVSAVRAAGLLIKEER
jgi:hypothetical protein